MSGTHIALLRGINVGKAKRVAMADLRAVVEGLGYGDVRTLLNSGNIVFTVPQGTRGDPRARIERAIADDLGVASRVTVLTAAEMSIVVAENPLLKVARDPSRHLIAVLGDPKHRARLLPLDRLKWAPEAMAVGKRVAYLWCPQGSIDSKAALSVAKALGDGVTTRNWATILKLHQAASPA